MNKRQVIISTIGGFIILAAAIKMSGVLASSKTPPARNAERTYKRVHTVRVANGEVQFTLPVYGKLNAFERIQIYAEVNGILKPTNKDFLEGVPYRKGESLLRIDNTEAMANLMAQRSNYLNSISAVLPDLKLDYPKDFDDWQKYLNELDIESDVPAPPKAGSKKSDLYLTARGVYSSYYNLKSAEARLDKYDIHAPYDGVVTQSNIRPGTLVRPGQLLGEYISAGKYLLETSVSNRFVPFLKIGNKVALRSADVGGEWTGTIERINKVIDEATQTVKVYIAVSSLNLREGMYLEGTMEGMHVSDAFAIPRRLLVDNDHVFLIEQDSVLQKTRVNIVEYTKENAIVRGLPEGSFLVNEVVPGAASGMIVRQQPRAAKN